jgi:LuxR family transcriptional regulator, maltose regulon positive regulatory protein
MRSSRQLLRMAPGDISALEARPVSRRARWDSLGAGQGLVQRRALFERLSGASPGRLVLVCAPAGSGKSVLVRSWAESSGWRERMAWVSVEPGERDGQRFWLSVIDALAQVVASVERMSPAPGFRGELAVERLLSELEALKEPVVLVIDDLGELRSAEALVWLELFLTRLPPQLLVVLVSREDPRLGLHRLRLAGELIELRGPDLAFSAEETRELLATSGITVSDAGALLLHERTEGWAAGLRLAVISLGQHPDPERFLREFSGSERNVAGYLLTEVLEHQPADVRELLLRTSILTRVSGPLADFLTGASGSERILQQLEDANAFVRSLDVGRTWFRYHQLFAELLQLELRRTSPELTRSLHRAAAEWHEREGDIVESIRHAQAAHEWRLASRLLADNHMDLALDGRTRTVSELLNAFPDDVAAADAELALVFATARLLDQELEGSAAYLELAQQRAATVPAARGRQLAVTMAVVRLAVARWRGDLGTVLEAMRSAEAGFEALEAGERALTDELRSAAFENLAVAELWCSRFADSRRHLEQALALARRARRPWLEIADLGHLGIAAPFSGQSLLHGLQFSEEAVRIADSRGWGEDPALLTALAAGAMTLLWLGRLDEADRWLGRAERTLRPGGEPATELIVHHARGVLHLAQGRFEEALAALRAAQQMQALLLSEHAFAVAVRARVIETQARMGDLAAARAALSELTESERDTAETRTAAAVVHLIEGEPEPAIGVLAPVLDLSAPTTYQPSATTEAQVLDAVARHRLGEWQAAEASLERAFELAEPEGIVLPFLLTPVRALLEHLPRHRTAHGALLRTILDVLGGTSAPRRGEPAPLREELSDAELRVVRYLPSNLKAPEIAAELWVSPNTVRTHIRHIYAKLGAHDRNDAVARARELGLLAR